MDKLISVIVPCYNVENYLERGIKSIAKQTYKNIEILAIDDCSTDSTYDILKRLENQIENLTVYKTEKNSGAGFCRNYLLKKAKGELIGFIDADDFVEENYYKKLEAAMKEDIDVVITDIKVLDSHYKQVIYNKACEEGKEVNKINIINNGLVASPCNKLIKKELVMKYSFMEEKKMNEDIASIIPVVANCNKIAYVDTTCYNYVQRQNSTQNSKFSEKRFEIFEAVEICLDRIKEREDYNELKEAILYNQLIMLYMSVLINQKGIFNRYKLIKEFMEKQKKYKLAENKYVQKYIDSQYDVNRNHFERLFKYLKEENALKTTLLVEYRNQRYKISKLLKEGIKDRIIDLYKTITKKNVIKRNITMNDIIKLAKKQSKKKQGDIKISVVVPNYNYEKFLLSRIYSILNQTEKIYELIILDDCSKDNSRTLINEMEEKLKDYINIKKVYNIENTGCAFKQWKKGFELATGDYVWIAEADDCCNKNLLKELISKIKENNDIYIAYVDTAFINVDDNVFLPTIKPEIDIRKTGHWDRDFVNKGIDELNTYSFLNCTIANVSSCLIKKENYDDIFEKIINYKQTGDWLFYINVMIKGSIAFVNKPLNYYRVHGENVTSTTKKQSHIDEIKKVHAEVYNMIDITPWHKEEIRKRYEFLVKVWELDPKINLE